jgi:FkbM family methyltransferase
MKHSRIDSIQTAYGVVAIDGYTDKKMAEALTRGAYPNEALIQLAKQFLTSDSIAVDVGAHIGTFALGLSTSSGKVIAFEPAPSTYELLVRNSTSNNASIDARNKGLASAVGRASVKGRNADNAGAQTLVSGGDIVVSTLDEEIERADFIKIDVEGMEEEVLRGAERLIAVHRPVVQFEVNLSQLRAHHSSVRSLELFFTRRGYHLFFPIIKEDTVVSLSAVGRLGVLIALLAPRAWGMHTSSEPFDILAIPSEKNIPIKKTAFHSAIAWGIKKHIENKKARVQALLHI